jgi:ADP-ribosylglycohydrolase
MISDDTEHTVFVAQCLAKSGGDSADFQRRLAWCLRFWLLCLPAGIGLATLRAIVKLWIGFPPSRSGVFSAGNGPAMRSAVIGVFFEDDPDRLAAYVRASTRLTHTDPKAETAALAVARTAAFASAGKDPGTVEDIWRGASPTDEQWQRLIDAIFSSLKQDRSVAEFAHSIGLHKGVSGYAYHSVPVALYSWLRHFGNFRAGLEAAINCGGDTDTVGAIAGSLLALNSPLPQDWQENIADYPVSTAYLTELARALEASRKGGGIPTPSFNWLALPFRNLLFLGVVLFHGFRRLIPV